MMDDIDEHTGHRYVPGHEREDYSWLQELLATAMEFWALIAMVAGGALLIAVLFGVHRMLKAMKEERSAPRPRSEAEKRDHIRAMRELRQTKADADAVRPSSASRP
ncbi:hypothetical protein [Roseobacter sp. HKCCA0434]|uniref:hypothetical protein n=1 Tax=Roseobacter sp. HKCCA0434 TaxID=3079297 RepID=UPI00290588B9|nr:hypothetical protein [Roseobacter sp. HKCCA0434]